jgi:hypothetical protein
MTLATLTLTRQAQTAVAPKTDPKAAAKPVAALAAFLKADSGLSIKAADKPDAARTAATSLEDAQKERRSSLKAQAKAQVMALLDRIRTLKQFASDNPQVMAKQLAAIVKELKSALKAYADAGGTPRGMDAAASAPGAPSQTAESPDETTDKAEAAVDQPVATDEASADDVPDAAATATAGDIDEKTVATPKPADLDPRNVYEKMRDSLSGSEAAGDMDFVKLVRGVGKVIRDLLNKAKIQTALKGPDDETKKAFKETEEGLKDLDKALETMDREIRNTSPAAGMFVALYA